MKTYPRKLDCLSDAGIVLYDWFSEEWSGERPGDRRSTEDLSRDQSTLFLGLPLDALESWELSLRWPGPPLVYFNPSIHSCRRKMAPLSAVFSSEGPPETLTRGPCVGLGDIAERLLSRLCVDGMLICSLCRNLE